MKNSVKVLKNLEGSAMTLYDNIAYHGCSLKVEVIFIKGEAPFKYYEWFGHWIEVDKEQALVILERY